MNRKHSSEMNKAFLYNEAHTVEEKKLSFCLIFLSTETENS